MPFDGQEIQYDATASELREARRRVDEAWCQGSLRERRRRVIPMPMTALDWRSPMNHPPAVAHVVYEEYDAVCAIGALNAVSGRCVDPPIESAMRLLEKALSIYWGKSNVAWWNDTKGRVKADVLKLYDQAIALREGEITHAKQI